MDQRISRDVNKELVIIVQQLLKESGQKYRREIKLSDSLSRHLGIDSLARAELFQRIEKHFQVNIPDRLLSEAESLQDIAHYLQNAEPTLKKPSTRYVIETHGGKSSVNPQQANSLLEVLLLYGEQSPHKAHVYFLNENEEEEIITYEQLLHSSLRVANGLRHHGLQEGETVAIMLPTEPGFFYSFFGTLLAGGVPVPIYPPFRAHMVEAYAKTEARILRNAEVRFLITFAQAENLSYLLQAFIPSLKEVITVDALLASEMLISPYHAHSESFAFIQYTSGSTSDPKGVLLTHGNLLTNIRAYGEIVQICSEDISVSWLPLYHDMGLIGMWLGSLYHGIPLILMTPFAFLNHPERWLWAIHYHRGTLSGAPNFAYELCVRKIAPEVIEGLDLSSWRVAANGAEKIYPRTLEQFAKKFAPYGFNRGALLPVYGLAESTVSLTIPPLDRDFRIDYVDRETFEKEARAIPSQAKNTLAFVSCGKAIPGHKIRIVDDQNQILVERHIGNLQFSGPSSMQGYYNNPQATQAIYHDGWLDTGDLAYIADEELFITGRRKDLIIKAGRNLYPVEIEEWVGNILGIRQGCVIAFGITDQERATEQLVVVAETAEKQRTKREEIIDAIKAKISDLLDIIPDDVILVSPRTVPKTSSGKLQRAACKKMYMENRLNKSRLPAWLQMTKLSVEWFLHESCRIVSIFLKMLYSCYAGLLTICILLPTFIFVLIFPRRWAANICRYTAKWLRRGYLCPLKVIGLEHLTEASPMIFVVNHASYIDSLIMLEIVPPHTRFVGKKELMATPVLRTFMRKLGYLSVDRIDLSKGLEDTKHIEKALNQGNSVLIFPEGTFGYASGLRPFRLGAFKVATDTKTPICPIALKGTRGILRAGERLLRPAWITVTIGKALAPRGTEWQDVTQLRNDARAQIAKYCGEPLLDYIAAQTIAPSKSEEY